MEAKKMFDLSDEVWGFCFERYNVAETVEVVVSMGGINRRVRIEALKGKEGDYRTRAYLEKSLGDDLESPTVWTSYVDFPWTHGDTAEFVLGQALGFLRERCDRPTAKDSPTEG